MIEKFYNEIKRLYPNIQSKIVENVREYFEYKNYIYTELLQRIQYLHQDKNTLTEYIKTELSSRYLVERMKEYFNDDCPSYMRPLVNDDYESIYLHTLDLAMADRKRFMLKKIFSYANSFLKFF